MQRRYSPPGRSYLFILKEGKEIQQDPFDYRLVLLDLRNREIISSPKNAASGDARRANDPTFPHIIECAQVGNYLPF